MHSCLASYAKRNDFYKDRSKLELLGSCELNAKSMLMDCVNFATRILTYSCCRVDNGVCALSNISTTTCPNSIIFALVSRCVSGTRGSD